MRCVHCWRNASLFEEQHLSEGPDGSVGNVHKLTSATLVDDRSSSPNLNNLICVCVSQSSSQAEHVSARLSSYGSYSHPSITSASPLGADLSPPTADVMRCDCATLLRQCVITASEISMLATGTPGCVERPGLVLI